MKGDNGGMTPQKLPASGSKSETFIKEMFYIYLQTVCLYYCILDQNVSDLQLLFTPTIYVKLSWNKRTVSNCFFVSLEMLQFVTLPERT